MTQVTRTRLRCNEKDCPRRDDEDFHQPVCYAIEAEHSSDAQHQHEPKRSQGGRYIPAVICSFCQDRIDNGKNVYGAGPWGNAVEFGYYRIWDVHGNTLLRVPAPEGSDGTTRADDKGTGLARDHSDDVAGSDAVGGDGDGDATDGNVDSLAGVAPSSEGEADPLAVTDLQSPSEPGEAPSDGTQGQYGKALLPTGESPNTAEALGPSPGVGQRSAPDPIPGGGAVAPLATDSGAPPPFTFHDNGIEFEPEITFATWEKAFEKAKAETRKERPWIVGDIIARGEAWQESFQRTDELLERYKEPTLSNYANVARAYPFEERRSLPWSYHQSCYKHPDRLKLLDKCLAEGLSRKELRGLAGYAPPPKPKKWTLAELHERQVEWDGGGSEAHQAVMDFLEHLEKG